MICSDCKIRRDFIFVVIFEYPTNQILSSFSVQANLSGIESALMSPPEPKREDLTERLKKEFGLKIDEDEDLKEGDETPETESPPPPPPPAAPPLSSISSHLRFTPTQYPSYPSNYPLPIYPSTKYPTTTTSSSASSTAVSAPPHPPLAPSISSSSYSGRDTLSYPPPLPPPPPAPVIANAPHPPPPSHLNRLDESLSHPSRTNGTASMGTNATSRRPGLSASSGKDYYSHNSSSTAAARGYYQQNSTGGGSGGSSRRDRDHRDHRDRDRDYHHRSSSTSNASSSSSSSSSASRRNVFHSGRTYY